MIQRFFFFYVIITIGTPLNAQVKSLEIEKLQQLISEFKADSRGPYKDIRWFCADGTINDPREPCNQEGSYQHARYKDQVNVIAEKNKIYLGQILTNTDFAKFWDNANFNDRYKQYQLEQFLKNIDNGWINRKAQFYRGAVQVEDEMKWGKDLLLTILEEGNNVKDKYFLIRQAVATIPHAEDDNIRQLVRSISKNISDEDSRFMNLRIKIHGNPGISDLKATASFLEETKNLKPSVRAQLITLSESLSKMYAPIDIDKMIKEASKLPQSVKAKDPIIEAFRRLKNPEFEYSTLVVISDALIEIRESILASKSAIGRLNLIDLSLHLEKILLNQLYQLKGEALGDLNSEICYLSGVSYATGYLESWEWDYLEGHLSTCQYDRFELYDLIAFHQAAKSSIEWGANMVRAIYNPTINKFGLFEPLSYGLIDDIVRSGPLLPLGQRISRLGDWLNVELQLFNDVIGVPNSSQIRGLNPGYAKGVLEVVSGDVEDLKIDKSRIYIFDQPPSDLKPIAGIATVSEGNPVSHIQLLARNLGVPNAVISLDDFNKLKKYRDQEVFYAVSPKGSVILKKTDDMSKVERALFTVKKRDEDKITVPIDRLALTNVDILNLRNLDKEDSGIFCGPKAANLGELKKLFPERVVDGLVIPFGIFRQHMDQLMPDSTNTYWGFVNTTFTRAEDMTREGVSQDVVESYQLSRLENLRHLIKNMSLLPEFERRLNEQFNIVLKGPIGEVPVFLRSDTNMEDLKDFTGAGLNLTLFNVLDEKAIVQGIKDVWASPYTERSFKWRQKFLLNPENVYPSILIIPSVNVDYSGVLITKGLKTDDFKDLTVAFNRGVGGAVDGQAAESYTIHHLGYNYLDAPSREIKKRVLPVTGGTTEEYVTFSTPILSDVNLKDIRQLAIDARNLIQFSTDRHQEIAHDIEFGFLNDQLWLFQVRPFVENKNSRSSDYLNSISPPYPKNRYIDYSITIL